LYLYRVFYIARYISVNIINRYIYLLNLTLVVIINNSSSKLYQILYYE